MEEEKFKTILVIECTEIFNWYQIFEGAKLSSGHKIKVEQCTFPDLNVVSYHDTGVVVTIRPAKKPLPGTNQNQNRTIKIDFVLMRSVQKGHGMDDTNKLYGLLHGNLPSVNTLQSCVFALEKATMWAELKKVRNKLGRDKFPLIDQTYYTNYASMIISPDFPCVAKVGTFHAGYGKMKLKSPEEFQDFKSLIACNNQYVTLEPFVKWDFDLRIQKIGPHYRVFKRRSPNWKGNTGNSSVLEDGELTPEFKLWADECSKLCGGLDILGLDLLHDEKEDKYYILELNDTAIGLVHKYEDEDNGYIRDICMSRMEELWGTGNKEEKKDESEEEKIKRLENEVSILREEIKRLKEEKQKDEKQDPKEKKSIFKKKDKK